MVCSSNRIPTSNKQKELVHIHNHMNDFLKYYAKQKKPDPEDYMKL